ncbi:4-phosphoerythronate dehydrogenase [uncultured Alistipes sp.]|jgi:4-phosphoerythronate dehydrogenase|uniref:4-phosphoerythronate dehydrogenase n=1 Tax=uncultured Alistipes sp. TaxID=538949 RepID=UPI0025E2A394|nr:4-phosphoerythronate dehydrogenase [uncultured Alistipes sp.]
MKIIADSAIPFLQGVLEPWAEVHYLPGAQIGTDDVRDADALIIRTRTRCAGRLLSGSRVRLIATATIGFDHIDTAWCAAHGIRVATAAGCNARGVLQWAGAVLAYLAQKQGWTPAERTLGIVGVGHVGSLVKTYAEAWGFRVLCCDPPREAREHLGFLPLENVACEADILTLHTPLDSTTHHMIGDTLLAQMKPGAVILNSSRGEVIDERALLESGHPCVLDVWEHEPRIDRRLLERALLATPHIAGYSEQGKANATAMSVDAVARAFDLPLHDWYPPLAAPSAPRPISWQKLGATIRRAFDIEAESRHLKSRPEEFERMRDHYRYRREYF